ncbi:MAG: ATP-binding cassette domain-containing protein, partial [Alphaproteobacteria bacterium]|nr:ATP-binding cassette domain-containing protein [Alphaproteobacteria bacterium]
MLSVRDLTRPGLAPASFDLADGECVAVRGVSGSGKTLLLRAVADLDPAEGTVTLDGAPREAISGPQWRRLVGYLPAEPGWWGEAVAEHFEDWAGMAPLVLRLGLPDGAGDWPVARLSTGERQRLALLRAIER